MNILTYTKNGMQERCEAIGAASPAYLETDSDGTSYPLGLCPRCQEPICLRFVNGGKLHSAKTLRAEHVFSGDVRCEDAATNATLAPMTGEQKVEFFFRRHGLQVLDEAGITSEEREKILKYMSDINHPLLPQMQKP